MKDKKQVFKEQLIKTIEIQGELINDFELFDAKITALMTDNGIRWRERIQTECFTLRELRSIARMVLSYWNESIGIPTELFWSELKKNDVPFERKDPLKSVLKRGRFRRFDLGVAARNYWILIKDSKAIRSRFTPTEIDTISDIIAKEEQARVELLKKCIILRKVPQKEYLKFNDSITYMQQCNLWSTHFSSTEQHLLELIAENLSEWLNSSNINTPDT